MANKEAPWLIRAADFVPHMVGKILVGPGREIRARIVGYPVTTLLAFGLWNLLSSGAFDQVSVSYNDTSYSPQGIYYQQPSPTPYHQEATPTTMSASIPLNPVLQHTIAPGEYVSTILFPYRPSLPMPSCLEYVPPSSQPNAPIQYQTLYDRNTALNDAQFHWVNPGGTLKVNPGACAEQQ